MVLVALSEQLLGLFMHVCAGILDCGERQKTLRKYTIRLWMVLHAWRRSSTAPGRQSECATAWAAMACPKLC